MDNVKDKIELKLFLLLRVKTKKKNGFMMAKSIKKKKMILFLTGTHFNKLIGCIDEYGGTMASAKRLWASLCGITVCKTLIYFVFRLFIVSNII